VDLRRAHRADEGHDVSLRREFRERKYASGIGRSVVLNNEFYLLPEHAASLVNNVDDELRADLCVATTFGG
jgi:hypothetical protein